MEINDILSQAIPFIAWTFDKKMSVYELTNFEKDNGSTGQRIEQVDGLTDIPCRLSVRNLKNTEQDEANKLVENLKVFCGPDVTIKPGSMIKIDGMEYMTSTENPMVYVTHQEVLISHDEWI